MTIRELYDETKGRIRSAGLESETAEARFLFEGILGIDYQNILLCGDLPVSDEQEDRMRDAVSRRITGYPLQYITGSWEFYSYPFEVGEGVLIPRQDTEALCSVGIRLISRSEKQTPIVADLCSGSGCVAVTVALRCPNAKVYAVEKYDEALFYLRRNVDLNKAPVRIIQGDVLEGGFLEPAEPIDLILCNPPYLTESDMAWRQKEVEFEPETSLYGGKDGLLFFRCIAEQWSVRLAPGGILAFEIGKDQHDDVTQILKGNGYQNICTYQDLYGIIRVVTGQKPES